MIRYRVEGDMTEPHPVECVHGSNYDAEDQKIYDNTHFDTQAEAWAWLGRDSEAHISLAARRLVETRAELWQLESDAANAVVRRAAINLNREAWEEKKNDHK